MEFDRRTLLQAGLASSLFIPASKLPAQSLDGPKLPIQLTMNGGAAPFRMHPKAAIASYPIRFFMAAEANAGGRVGIFLLLEGPTEADMNALAAEARNDLASRLKAINYGVVEPSVLLADPAYAKIAKAASKGRWDSGVPDPMGKRFWYITSSPDAPLIEGWGTTSLSKEMSLINKMTDPSRSMDAVVMIPELVLEFSTLSGSVNSGSKGSTAWAGGEILFGYKPQSIGWHMAGGKRSIEMKGGSFYPKGRVLISPTKLPGNLKTDAQPLSPDMAKRLGKGRFDTFTVDMNAWREWVRSAYRGYNDVIAGHIAKALAGK